ncbi:hypothetical protein LTR09_002176 [Extremus antarcticus]|uniref:Uncharacterized protein n=1 Tax=Extremus antarcticus TaxID=702011 RepID=A0AAJ0LVW9_9PEZI|nr:hypothetical protein LTR09_002176 [Extremus antarcticus]
MAQLGQPSSMELNSNNPYAKASASPAPESARLAKEQQQSPDSEKQVVSSEGSTGPNNAPMVVAEDASLNSPIPVAEPEYEAGKEVASSWQTRSKEESAPISMQYHETTPQPSSDFINDVKGPPPAYDSLNRQTSTQSDDLLSSPSAIEPDNGGSRIPKPEDRTAVGQLLSWIPAAPRTHPSQMPPLAQPVVIPQLDVPPQGESVPFMRCYSETLASHEVSMRDFLSFLDGLALAQAPNSTLQGLKMFGVGVGSLPIPIIPLAGKGISALATSGSGHSSSRARLYLERAKKEYFAPRGLSMTIVRDGDLSARLQIPSHASRLAPLTKNSLTENSCKRRLNGLAPYIAPLRFNVSEPDKQLQGVHKMARKHLESRFKGQAREITKLRERQWEEISGVGQEMSGWEEQYAFKMGQVRRVQDGIVDEQKRSHGEKPSGALAEKLEALRELQRALQLMESQRYTAIQNAVGSSQGVEAEMQEITLTSKLKWIVVETIQQ